VTLPPGYTLRRPTVDDAHAIHELVVLSDTAAIGRADATLDDIRDELIEPGFDMAVDGWLVHSPAGRLVTWAWACRKGTSDNVDVAVITAPDDDAAAAHLFGLVRERAVEIARELGHPRAVVDAGAYRQDERQRGHLAAAGYAPAATFQRLRIDHDGPRPYPVDPDGVTVIDGTHGEDVRRRAHAVRNESFAEHFGSVPLDYDEWVKGLEASYSHDWAQLRLVLVDGEPAAMLLGTDNFRYDENCGYVRTLGVLRPYRGRGLARHLLRIAFAFDAANGRAGTMLHVDSVGAAAVGLYTSEGMRPVLISDVWRQTVPTA
jgi:ribosomal protein S18 acetylase RimI-like enzyme